MLAHALFITASIIMGRCIYKLFRYKNEIRNSFCKRDDLIVKCFALVWLLVAVAMAWASLLVFIIQSPDLRWAWPRG